MNNTDAKLDISGLDKAINDINMELDVGKFGKADKIA